MSQSWFLIRSGPTEPALNMALDEALLERAAELGRPVFRFYGWTEPAATFGYFQRYVEVATWTPLRPLIRRPTGGGLVPHDADWTYSLAFPPQHFWYELPARESYRRVHLWIHAAFQTLGVPTGLATAKQEASPGQCFAGAEQFDLLWRGAKVAGAAQRRNRAGLLIQGSVQPRGSGWARADWEEAMLVSAPSPERVTWESLDPLPTTSGQSATELHDAPALARQESVVRTHQRALQDRAAELQRQKYSLPAYNQRR
jgi:lipoate-protein ligase A